MEGTFASRKLDDYITVADRIVAFKTKYPEGTLQSVLLHHDNERVVMKGLAFRTPDDPCPGVGHAEEVRAASHVNKSSAMENAETSAWGRALAALGFGVRKNGAIASREEVDKVERTEAASRVGPTGATQSGAPRRFPARPQQPGPPRD